MIDKYLKDNSNESEEINFFKSLEAKYLETTMKIQNFQKNILFFSNFVKKNRKNIYLKNLKERYFKIPSGCYQKFEFYDDFLSEINNETKT